MMRRALARTGGVVVLTTALLTGCLSDGSCAGVIGAAPASASCAAGVEYQGEFYVAWTDDLPVAQGESLGEALYPTCADTGCEPEGEPRPTQVWALRGVDPAELVVGRTEGSRRLVVLAAPGADPRDYFRLEGGEWHRRQSGAAAAS